MSFPAFETTSEVVSRWALAAAATNSCTAGPTAALHWTREGSKFSALEKSTFAMSAPAYDPTSNDVWYTDSNKGLYVVHLVGPAAIPFAKQYFSPGS